MAKRFKPDAKRAAQRDMRGRFLMLLLSRPEANFLARCRVHLQDVWT